MKKTTFSRVAALLLASSALAFSQFALAHAHLKTPVPADKATVATSPKSLTLTFTEDVEPAFSGVEIRDAHNQTVQVGKVQVNDKQHAQLIVPINQPLPAGSYKVNWHVLSVDGHKTKGSYQFSVK